MYFLAVSAKTLPENPEHGLIGEAYVACWIDAETESEAKQTAHQMIRDDGFKVIDTEQLLTVTAENYEDDDPNLQYYQQAVTDKTVLVVNVCPRYPVYFLSAAIEQNVAVDSEDPPVTCEARIWISNEVVDDDHDPMEPDFWSGPRVETALRIATQTIEDNDHRVIQFTDQYPCGPDEASEEVRFYDDAESDGVCVVIVHQGTEGNREINS